MDETKQVHLIDKANAIRFMLAGKATFTVVREATDTHMAYTVRRTSWSDDEYWVFTCGKYLGMIKDEGERTHLRRTKKSKFKADTPQFRILDWTITALKHGWEKLDEIELWHAGHCCRCGAELTTPESIADGIGPVCKKKMTSWEG